MMKHVDDDEAAVTQAAADGSTVPGIPVPAAPVPAAPVLGTPAPGVESAAVDRMPARMQGIVQVFARLGTVLDDEREALQQGRMSELDGLAQRKSQCLLDLARLSRGVDVAAMTDGAGRRIFLDEVGRIKARLDDNEAMLKRYAEAAREVSALVADSLRASDSDGTYAESGPFGRYGR